MSKYKVAWKASNKTMIIKPGDAEDTTTHKVIGDLVLPELGQIPDAQPHPSVHDHLRNLAMKMGVKDFRLVTVENRTDNERFDRYVQEPTDEYLEQREKERQAAVVANTGFNPNDMDAGEDEEIEDDENEPVTA